MVDYLDMDTGAEYDAMRNIGNTLISLGDRIGQDYINKLNASEKANARARQIKEMTNFKQWLSENRDKPDTWLDEFNKRKEKISENIIKPIRTPGARNEIESELTVDLAEYESSLTSAIQNQIDVNAIADYKINMETITAPPPAGIPYDEDEVQRRLDKVIMLTKDQMNNGNLTETKREYEIMNASKNILNYYVSQNALAKTPEEAEKYLDNINSEIEEKFGISNLFSQPEAAKFKEDYDNQVKTSNLKEAEQSRIEQAEDIETFSQTLIDPQNYINEFQLDNSRISTLGKETEIFELTKGEYASYKSIWQAIVGGQAEPAATDTDYKRYEQLQEMLFKYWNNEYGYQKEDMQTLLAYEYSVQKSLTKEDYIDLKSRLDINLPKDVRSNLQDIFEQNKNAAKSIWKKEKTEKELSTAQNRAAIDTALLEYAQSQVEKGGTITKKDIGMKFLELMPKINQFLSPESPYSDYPDAYYENGNWYVIQDGNRYRIED